MGNHINILKCPKVFLLTCWNPLESSRYMNTSEKLTHKTASLIQHKERQQTANQCAFFLYPFLLRPQLP